MLVHSFLPLAQIYRPRNRAHVESHRILLLFEILERRPDRKWPKPPARHDCRANGAQGSATRWLDLSHSRSCHVQKYKHYKQKRRLHTQLIEEHTLGLGLGTILIEPFEP